MKQKLQEVVWALPEPDLSQLAEFVGQLLALRQKYSGAPESPTGKIGPAPPVLPAPDGLVESVPLARNAAASHLARRPLRQPKPGSLRGDVHAVLQRMAKPMSRSEISSRVAAKRQVPCDEALTNKVGEILRCPHDSRIKKLRHGIYRYVE